ncbi:sigma-70 family RNA polymerase sigma factor [Micromonospora sp. NPDC093244]|uniref:sigma-70 family RNA polymerase sigma factor n=1 Tax=Micromonospora sp. NPDC093244 TaxID=3155071 RepID=UPI003421A1A8
MSAEVVAAVAQAHRRDWAHVLAATARLTRDLDLAEECTQDAYAQALRTWPQIGVPDRPGAWLTTAARNRARDVLRRESAMRRALPLLVPDQVVAGPEDGLDDDRLRLVFTCCHPALSRDAQVALTLRLVCGLSTAEVARAFLVPEPTMAARITRAKKKITNARIPYRVPSPDHLAARVNAVLEVIHLIFTTGHTAPTGAQLVRRDLVDSAIGLARMLHLLMPNDAEISALLALLLLVHARADSRLSATGRLQLLSEQDRGRWDTQLISEGVALLTGALHRQPPTRYAVEAAIAAVHTEAPTWQETDWVEIVGLYDVLLNLWPSPVVELNRAVAVGMRDGPQAGLDALTPLLAEPVLATYGYLSAARADFLRQLHRWAEASDAYHEAMTLTDNGVERAFLAERLAEMQRAVSDRGLVSVSRRIAAPAADIFRILADPRRHNDIDGSGMLRGAVSDQVVSAVGDVFVMKMHYPPYGDYEMDNHVIEYEVDRRIGWRPEPGRGHPDTAPGSTTPRRWGHRWTYELTPDGPDATVVTEIYDCSHVPEDRRESMDGGRIWLTSMTETLQRLDALCAEERHTPGTH